MPNFCAINVGPVAVKLLSEGDRIVLGHTTKKSFEPESLQAWALMCAAAEGAWCVDVGAYTGLFTIGARLLGRMSWRSSLCRSIWPAPGRTAP
jgi:hypothetical protein